MGNTKWSKHGTTAEFVHCRVPARYTASTPTLPLNGPGTAVRLNALVILHPSFVLGRSHEVGGDIEA
jgi:hypothetical protein